MTPLRLSDLPPAVRARVVAHAEELSRELPTREPHATTPTDHFPWRCRCGATFTQWAGAQRHGMGECPEGFHRIDLVLDKEASCAATES